MSSPSSIPDGALSCLIASQAAVGTQDIEQDHDDAVESLLAGINLGDVAENSGSQSTTTTYHLPVAKKQKLDLGVMKVNLKKASENVVVDNTLKEYRRLWNTFKAFCVTMGFVENEEKMDKYSQDIPEELPSWVAVWIMDRADELDIHTGKPKDITVERVKYATAQKMRAAISHKFGRDFGFGQQPWARNPVTGQYSGNPSLSVVVSQYMVSLQRRKIRAGEDVTSARAITHGTMRMLWEYNEINFPTGSTRASASRKDKAEHPEQWAGYRVRRMLHLLYVISMLCLLRVEEALRIMWTDVRMFVIDSESEDKKLYCVQLDLPFRKQAQYGGIAPFFLYANVDDRHLCPVTAFAEWWKICKAIKIEPGGYVFRKRIGFDDISIRASDGMSYDSYVECFKNSLLDIRIDPRPYGTHSFRRGGCQYLAMVKRWPIRDICTWGGWAENFDNAGTIFKYLLSSVDAPLVDRRDYFNPNRAASDPCNKCGRTCHCA